MNRITQEISLTLLAFVFLFTSAILPVYPQSVNLNQRVALVIGNADYKLGPLLNPVNDARAMANALQSTGFEVIKYENIPTMVDMKKAVREFGQKIQNGGVGLFYYAGHGIQVKGNNYLIPTQAEIFKEEEVEYESLDVGFVLTQMEIAHNRMNIVILDACRNNPFARSWRSAAQGLAFINAPAGTLIAYATAPGSVASDGTGNNGLYTEEFLKQINKNGLKIEDLFKNVRVGVMERSNNLQTPWESSSLVGDFYFTDKPASTVASETSVPLAEINTETTENPAQDLDYFEGFSKSQSDEREYLPVIDWKVSNNMYSFFLDGRDITNETSSTPSGNDLLVYHNNTGKYFILYYYSGNLDNTAGQATALSLSSTACWMAKNNKYWLYDRGKDITSQTISAFYDEHLLVYDKLNRQYYYCPFLTQYMDGFYYQADPVYSANGTLWRYNGSYYFLYVEGVQIGARTFSQWNGNDLIVYDEQAFSSYLLPDLYNSNDNVLRQAEIIVAPGMITWARQDNTYYMYRNGLQFASPENTVSDFSGSDLIVYEKNYQQTYLLQNWVSSNDFIQRTPIVLFSPTGVFWRRAGNTYSVYRYGQLITYQLTSNFNGNDLVVYDSNLGLTYILPNYNFSDDNILRAAYLKQ